MKNIENIFDILDSVLPNDFTKIVFFCEVETSSHEIFYYASFPDNTRKQCYELAEEGKVDEYTLDKGFDIIADYIRDTDVFDPSKRNVVTILIEGMERKVNFETFGYDVNLYEIKKEWKAANL